VSKRDDELEGQRKQREIRTPSRTRSEPAHGRLNAISRNHSADTSGKSSYNVTFGNGPNCDSSDVLPKILTSRSRPQWLSPPASGAAGEVFPKAADPCP
jgi:hypothetical protein